MARPWMPFYGDDYMADTGHLSRADHGSYLLLIIYYWHHGRLPTDDATLARIANASPKEWKTSKPILQAFFFDGWRHKRVDAELSKSEAAYDRRANAGRIGGVSKAAARPQNPSNARAREASNATASEASETLATHIHSRTLSEDSTHNPNIRASSSSILRDSPAEHDASHPSAAAAASSVEDFEEKCFKASGLTRKPAGFQVILDLDLPFDRQILPAIQSVAARRNAQNDACPVSSWSYFIPAIREFVPARCASAGPPMVFVERGTAAWREQISRGHRDGLVKHDRGKDGWFFPAEPLAAAAQ